MSATTANLDSAAGLQARSQEGILFVALRISSHFKTSIVIDGENIPIKIARLTPQQSLTFHRDFRRFSQPMPKAPEAETTDQQAARDQQEYEFATALFDIINGNISAYVSIEPAQLFEDDQEESFIDGATFVRLYGSRDDLLQELMFAIFLENKLSAEQKAGWRERSRPAVPAPADVTEAPQLEAVGA